MAKELVEESISSSKEAGTYLLPSNMGEIILGKAYAKDEKTYLFYKEIKETLPLKYREGVTDDDIKWWWNINDVERYILEKKDIESRFLMIVEHVYEYAGEISEEKAIEEGINQVRKYHPIYSAYLKPMSKEDPIPIELKDRVNIYIEKRSKGNIDEYKREIEESSSFNDLIRREIKNGKL